MQVKGKRKYEREKDLLSKASFPDYLCVILMFAEDWANNMEGLIKTGTSVAKAAEETKEKLIKQHAINGLMFGGALILLALHWKHGTELLEWHNEQFYDINPDVVIKANFDRSLVNPSIVLIDMEN